MRKAKIGKAERVARQIVRRLPMRAYYSMETNRMRRCWLEAIAAALRKAGMKRKCSGAMTRRLFSITRAKKRISIITPTAFISGNVPMSRCCCHRRN